jgi:hypothetical protein
VSRFAVEDKYANNRGNSRFPYSYSQNESTHSFIRLGVSRFAFQVRFFFCLRMFCCVVLIWRMCSVFCMVFHIVCGVTGPLMPVEICQVSLQVSAGESHLTFSFDCS